ncbi:MAG TPA: rhodanese-like domain-containing protein [Thermoanaerobaculia bacterium]|nr:rhodanese-like domain-containing protein [Thermoanaerobaculia bacterium]
MHLIALLILATTITTKADVPRLNPQELHDLMQKGEAVAIDVRGSVPYELGHIKGATWLPLGLLAQRVGELPEDKLIVAYCTCKAEEVSLEAAMLLAQQYDRRVAVLTGGYPAWHEAGLPTEVIQTVHFAEGQPADTTSASRSRGGRLAPPAAVSCDRNELTSYSGRITSYKREKGRTVLVMRTSADTTERLTVAHKGSDDPSRFYLIEGTAFTSRDWTRIEAGKGKLRDKMSAIAWVCSNGTTFIDWRPGATFTGAE